MPYQIGDTIPADATDLYGTIRLLWVDPDSRLIYHVGVINEWSVQFFQRLDKGAPQRYGNTCALGRI